MSDALVGSASPSTMPAIAARALAASSPSRSAAHATARSYSVLGRLRYPRAMPSARLALVIVAACGGSHPGTSADAPPGGDAADARPAPLALCDGLVQDLQPRPMTALARPAVAATVTDGELGTTIRRVTDAAATGGYAIVPMY